MKTVGSTRCNTDILIHMVVPQIHPSYPDLSALRYGDVRNSAISAISVFVMEQQLEVEECTAANVQRGTENSAAGSAAAAAALDPTAVASLDNSTASLDNSTASLDNSTVSLDNSTASVDNSTAAAAAVNNATAAAAAAAAVNNATAGPAAVDNSTAAAATVTVTVTVTEAAVSPIFLSLLQYTELSPRQPLVLRAPRPMRERLVKPRLLRRLPRRPQKPKLYVVCCCKYKSYAYRNCVGCCRRCPERR
ncbi:hypothetical protein B0H10DRAFT_2035277 [Mycena sp. CBHHK59/15]|nr:hypothetical protein B0H10DRAFT_2035277 [Mycena sp. CBHHK59/15]